VVDFRLLDDSAAMIAYLAGLGRPAALAIDTEADSLYSYQEKACLVQLTTEQGNAVLDPLRAPEGIAALGPLLADPAVCKVFHGADYDLRQLKKAFGFAVCHIVDTMVAAQLCGRTVFGLAGLLAEEFGLGLAKTHQRDDWARRPLSSEQLLYAALDTAYLLPLWERLKAQLAALGRLEWAEEEFALLQQITPAPPHTPTWMDVKGAYALEPHQRAIVQALVGVRDRTARAWDRPAFKVLSDRVLVGWALDPPRSRDEVHHTLGANAGILRRLAPEVLEAICHASEKDLPRRTHGPGPFLGPLTSSQAARLTRLKGVRQAVSERLGLAPGLLVTSETLERLARLTPAQAPTGMAEMMKRWQRSVLEKDLTAVW
jgi:ribonuclease D